MPDDASEGLRHVWGLGNYALIARQILPISAELVLAAGVGPGARVLDVATGTGNAAAEAARRGAEVSGIDFSPTQIERARERCAAEGLTVDFRVGDAGSLEWPDGSFDAVLSAMGVIFVPDHRQAAAELARVCRPGGTVAISAWFGGGWFTKWQARAGDLIPPPPPAPAGSAPAPDAWGDLEEMRRRLEAAGLDTTVTERPFAYRFASLDEALDTFLHGAGPFVRMMSAAATLGREQEAREVLREVLDEHNTATDGTVILPSPYLLGVGHRRAG